MYGLHDIICENLHGVTVDKLKEMIDRDERIQNIKRSGLWVGEVFDKKVIPFNLPRYVTVDLSRVSHRILNYYIGEDGKFHILIELVEPKKWSKIINGERKLKAVLRAVSTLDFNMHVITFDIKVKEE